MTRQLVAGFIMILAAGSLAAQTEPKTSSSTKTAEPAIDFEKARELFQKRQRGGKLTPEEERYVQRAMEARRKQQGGQPQANLTPRESTGMKPLTEMSAEDHYKGEDGGLYGGGQNTPPAAHRQSAEKELATIQPLDADGRPAANGRVVFISISMSNATQEFSRFKRIADADPQKSAKLTIVDCAQGGRTMEAWARPDADCWGVALERIKNAGVMPQQVQVAWIKLANAGPRGELTDHAKKLQRDTTTVLQNAKTRFPNLRIAYLSSRIYGGYATTPLNPEPYAYEGAFAVRWLIRDQIAGDAALNFNPDKGAVKSPLLLWGPYLWADGTTPRKADKLIYTRDDLAGDGTHPSHAGQDKVAKVMLDFYKTDPFTKPWFTR